MGAKAKWLQLVFSLAALVFCAVAGRAATRDKPAVWKEIDDALLRVNDAPVKDWGVYETTKKRDSLLVQMGNRFLLIQIHERKIFEVDPKSVQRKSGELLCDPNNHPAQPLSVADWDAGDMEAVFRIRAKLVAEDHVLDIEIPHQLDLSGMTPHN